MQVLTRPDRERIAELRERDEFFWLDLIAPSDDDLRALFEQLELHRLALEDTLEFGQRPKADSYRDHVLLVFYSARVVGDKVGFEPVEVHVYVHGGFLLTIHHARCPQLADLHEPLDGSEQPSEEGVVYQVLDALADAYQPVIDALDERVDEIEGAVLTQPQNRQLTDLYRLKQDMHALRRRAQAQRDRFGDAVESIVAVPGLTRATRPYLADVGDQVTETAGELDRLHADLAALTETFFNANTDRLNRLATRLSVLATIFLVVTLSTSFFGQNFKWLTDNVESRGDFLAFGLGGVLVPTVVIGLVFFVKRHDWL